NASTSVQQAPKVTGLVGHPSNGSKVYQSQEWASNGDSSVAITAASTGSTDTFAQFGLSVEQGKTYTILATANMPNDAYLGSTSRRRTICIYGGQSVTGGVETASESAPIGVGTVRLVFTAAATGTAQVRLYSGAATETARWDDLLIVEGEYTGPYFQ
ncbi:MAG TPA: hypothetical protein VFS65_00210, partial [Candidatus Saccharimonadales bacterium]|nr:hypothetical protein [Candidatus Saccharimonadales bacterium]